MYCQCWHLRLSSIPVADIRIIVSACVRQESLLSGVFQPVLRTAIDADLTFPSGECSTDGLVCCGSLLTPSFASSFRPKWGCWKPAFLLEKLC